MYITLARAKKQLNIENDFIEDDIFINDLIDVAECAVENDIHQNLSDIETANNGVIPASLLQAVLIRIADLYENRGMVTFTAKANILGCYENLIYRYKNFLN